MPRNRNADLHIAVVGADHGFGFDPPDPWLAPKETSSEHFCHPHCDADGHGGSSPEQRRGGRDYVEGQAFPEWDRCAGNDDRSGVRLVLAERAITKEGSTTDDGVWKGGNRDRGHTSELPGGRGRPVSALRSRAALTGPRR
jgi:hypothetical protein